MKCIKDKSKTVGLYDLILLEKLITQIKQSKIIIPKELKKIIRKELAELNYTNESLSVNEDDPLFGASVPFISANCNNIFKLHFL